MQGGHNGLYLDQESPVRCTSHWLLIFAKAYELFYNEEYLKAVCKCADYLLLDSNYPGGYTYLCRNKKGKDQCNGLIGQAWVIEALAKGYSLLNDDKYIRRAVDCFNLHPHCHLTGLWSRIEVNGKNIGLDLTFNHQLWFCMSGVLIIEHDNEVKSKVFRFLEKFNDNIIIRKNGRIGHQLYIGFYGSRIKPYIRSQLGKGGGGIILRKKLVIMRLTLMHCQ